MPLANVHGDSLYRHATEHCARIQEMQWPLKQFSKATLVKVYDGCC